MTATPTQGSHWCWRNRGCAGIEACCESGSRRDRRCRDTVRRAMGPRGHPNGDQEQVRPRLTDPERALLRIRLGRLREPDRHRESSQNHPANDYEWPLCECWAPNTNWLALCHVRCLPGFAAHPIGRRGAQASPAAIPPTLARPLAHRHQLGRCLRAAGAERVRPFSMGLPSDQFQQWGPAEAFAGVRGPSL